MGVDIFKDLGIGNKGSGLSLSDKNRLVAIANTATSLSTPIMADLASVVGSPATATDTEAVAIANIQNAKNTMATNIAALGTTAAGTDSLASLATKVGSVTKNGAVTLTPGTANVTIAKGYHNGSGYVVGDADLVTGNIRAGVSIFGVVGKSTVQDNTVSTNPISQATVLSGYTGFANGNAITGTMLNRTFAANSNNYISAISAKGDNGGTLCVVPQAGYYAQEQNGSAFGPIAAWDANFVPANILSGKTIFGVAGTAISGKRYATGSFVMTVDVSYNWAEQTFSGLYSFTPSVVAVAANDSTFWNVAPVSVMAKALGVPRYFRSGGDYNDGLTVYSDSYVNGGFKVKIQKDSNKTDYNAATSTTITWYAWE